MYSSTQELVTRGVAAAPADPWLPVFSGGAAAVVGVAWFVSMLSSVCDAEVSWGVDVSFAPVDVTPSVFPFTAIDGICAGPAWPANLTELELGLPLPVEEGENCLGGTKETAALVGVSIRPVLVFGMDTLGGESGEGGKKSSGYYNIQKYVNILMFVLKIITGL